MKITRYKLSKKVQLKLLEFFVAEVTARTSVDLLGIRYNTAILFYHKIRLVIEYNLNLEAHTLFDSEVELDESYFGDVHKGKQGRGAGGKTAVFGLLKRNGKVFVVVVKDTKTNTLMPIITSKIKFDSIVYTDSYKSYNALDVSDFKHFRINHFPKNLHKTITTSTAPQTSGIKPREYRRYYNGIDKKHFHPFIKECEFCFNYGTPSQKLKTLRKWCGI